MKAQIVALGVGSAFSLQNYNANYLLIINGKKLLIDCGGDIRLSLASAGYSASDIDAVFVSHLHGDHCGGLEYLGFKRYFCENPIRPVLYCSNTIDVWDGYLSKTMSLPDRKATLNSFFELGWVAQDNIFDWQGNTFEIIRTIHALGNKRFLPAYSLLCNINGYKVFFSCDSSSTFALNDLSYDLIIHDCEVLYDYKHNIIKSKCHTHYEDLKKLPDGVRKKMYLTHYQDNAEKLCPNSIQDGFKGFLHQGDVLDIS